MKYPATVNFVPTTAQQTYLGEQLTRVSRSFALVVPFVEPPARHYLAAAYLLCRVVDNIEDCTQPDPWKQERFVEFRRLLHDPRYAEIILARWDQERWPGLTDDERHLMGLDCGLTLWQIYAQIPEAARDVLRHWVSVMAQGMSQMSDPAQRPCTVHRDGIDLMEEEADYDEYCYYVAGTVGHLATELVAMQYSLTDDVTRQLRSHAQACGRSLQKTNILKDFADDLARGICYLPDVWLRQADYAPLRLQGAAASWQLLVFNDLLRELRGATEYLLALPYNAPGYRRASLLCLLPAYQTVFLAAQRKATLFTAAHRVKISRPTMARCMVDAQTLLLDNDGIEHYSRNMESRIRERFQ